MKYKKFKRLILALKIYLILFIALSVMDGIKGSIESFKEGYNSDFAVHHGNKSKLSHAKEIIDVKPVKNTLLHQNSDFSITSIRSFQIQQRQNVYHSYTYYIIEFFKVSLAFIAVIFLVRFIVKAFNLLNMFKKLIILKKENLIILNKAAINLLAFGICFNLWLLITRIYSLNWVHLEGYVIDFNFSFDFNTIIIALIMLVVSWIIKFAIELKAENDLTI